MALAAAQAQVEEAVAKATAVEEVGDDLHGSEVKGQGKELQLPVLFLW